MSNVDDGLNQAFEIDIDSIPSVTANTQIVALNEPNTTVAEYIDHNAADEDFEQVRDNMKTLISKGNKMLDALIENAESSERDRTFEVAGTILKTLSEMNKDILGIRKQHAENKQLGKQNSEDKRIDDGGSINIDKAVFVGTTTDLLKQIRENKENK